MTPNASSAAVSLDKFSTEIRGAVNALLGLTDLLLDTPLDAMQREYVDVLRSTADRLLAIGGDAVAGDGFRARPQSFVPMDVRETVLQVADLAKALSANPTLTVSSDFGADLDVPLLGDRQYAEQALMSLVKACTSAPVADTLVIRADRVASQQVCLSLRVNSLTNPGWMSGELRRLVRSAERHVAALEIDDEADGTRISFALPVQAASGDPAAAEGTRRVLLVEDAADNQFIVRAFLRNEPYELDIVSTGGDAVERVRRGGYGLVLMDLEMPGMNGLEATSVIREWEQAHNRPGVPIIALTARSGAAEVARCLSRGFSGFLPKPVSKAAILSALKSYCVSVR